MVELTEITEESHVVVEPNNSAGDAASTSFKTGKSVDSSDDDDYSSDEEDDFDVNETLYDRIVALKDIISPQQRKNISSYYNTGMSVLTSMFSKGGNVLWALTASALLLGVPLSLSILAEQQLIEMEKSFDLQKDANDFLTGGEGAQAAAPAASAL